MGVENNECIIATTWDDKAVDVIEKGSLEMCPDAVNVAEFIDEID